MAHWSGDRVIADIRTPYEGSRYPQSWAL